MLIAFLDRAWLDLGVLSVAEGIASGVVLLLPLFSVWVRRGKREAPQDGQAASRRNAWVLLAESAIVLASGAVHEKIFVAAPEPEFSVSASYQLVSSVVTDENVSIRAYTNSEADHVTVEAKSDEFLATTYSMRSADKKNWIFPANFYIKGTYTVTIRAYDRDGNMASDAFTVTYPFYSIS